MLDDRFAPDERIAVGIRFDLGAVQQNNVPIDVILLGEKLKHAREDSSQYVFHTLGTKAIDGAEIWTLSPGNPYEHDILAHADGIGDLTRRVNSLCVSVDDKLWSASWDGSSLDRRRDRHLQRFGRLVNWSMVY